MEPSPSSSSCPPSSVDPAKLFLGGITQELDEDVLKEYFHKYGEVKEVAVMRDKVTGKVRGFGFIEFVDPVAAEKAINEEGEHLVSNVSVQVNRVRPRSEKRTYQSHHSGRVGVAKRDTNNIINHGNNAASRKIFVGGLSANITEDEFRRYFEQFGCITDVVIMHDNVSHRPRGFGFITFDSEESVEKALLKSFHELNSKVVEVKRAIPKDESQHTDEGGYNSMNNTSREGWGRESYFANYQSGFYPHFYSRYGYFYGYTPLPICGYGYGQVGYGFGYTYGGYGGNGYIGSNSSPRNSWNGHRVMSARNIPVPYARASTPEPVNMGTGGYVGVATAGYLRDEWSSSGKDGTNLQLTQPENRKGLEDETVKVNGG